VTAPHADQIVSGYLARLENALADLPAPRRAELLDDVGSHIAQARSSLAEETDAALLNILDKLGDPADIAADARERLGTRPGLPAEPVGMLEIAAIVALALVWPAGIALVWLSSAWSQRDKLVATVLVPGVMLAFLITSTVTISRLFTTLAFFILLTPIVWSIGAIYLAIRLYQTRRDGTRVHDASGALGILEIGAILLTPLFWPVGVVLLWKSAAWNLRDKLIGALLPPGGYLGVAIFLRSGLILPGAGSCTASADHLGNVTSSCTASGTGLPPVFTVLLVLVLLLLPLGSSIYLALRLRGQRMLRAALAA
jgi:uncharacterized membrane protein